MEQNLFEELQERKKLLVSIAKKATEYGWITLERQQEILHEINSVTFNLFSHVDPERIITRLISLSNNKEEIIEKNL